MTPAFISLSFSPWQCRIAMQVPVLGQLPTPHSSCVRLSCPTSTRGLPVGETKHRRNGRLSARVYCPNQVPWVVVWWSLWGEAVLCWKRRYVYGHDGCCRDAMLPEMVYLRLHTRWVDMEDPHAGVLSPFFCLYWIPVDCTLDLACTRACTAVVICKCWTGLVRELGAKRMYL